MDPIVIVCLIVSFACLAFVYLHLTVSKPNDLEAWKKFNRPQQILPRVKVRGVESAQVARVIRLEEKRNARK